MALFVSSIPQNPAGQLVPEEMRRFVLWLFERLNIACTPEAEDLYRVTLPASHWEAFENRSEVLFTFESERYDSTLQDSTIKDATIKNDLEFAAPGHRLFRWLFEMAISSGALESVTPAQQPEYVSEITNRLFSAYTLDGGSVHLAGCSLEDKWLVRFDLGGDGDSEPLDILLAPDGREMSRELQHELGINGTAAQPAGSDNATVERIIPPQLIAQISSQISSGLQQLAGQLHAADDEAEENGDQTNKNPVAVEQIFQRLMRVQLIRTRWASGKLRFTFDGQTVDSPFSGWARCLTAPQIECPRTGQLTRHLSVTDDRRLAALESIQTCEKTGRRVLADELVECTLSGKRCLPEFVGRCAVTNQAVLAESLLECPACRQAVSPANLSGARCQGCRQITKVAKTDARLSLILTEYPKLDGWRRWRLAETEANFLVVARRGLQRLLLVVDKETVQVKFVGRGGLRPGWTPVESVEEQAEILGAWE